MANHDKRWLLCCASEACLDNSNALFDEAELLFEQGRYARTLSLAVLAREELGKAVLFAAAAAGRLQKLAPALLTASWSNPMKSHEIKQHISEIASITNALTEDHLDAIAGDVPEVGGWTYVEWFWEFVDQIETWAVEEGLAEAQGDRLRKRIREIPREFRQAMEKAFPRQLREEPRRSDQEKKNLGFYVDISGNDILQPSDISRETAHEMLIHGELQPIQRRLRLALRDLAASEE